MNHTQETASKPTALITGGARGIGRAIAERLLADGWNVAILDIKPPEQPDERMLSLQGDVAVETEVESALRNTLAHFGRLDGLVNNAGIAANRPLEELELADWNRVLATNLTGIYLCTRKAAEALRTHRGAVVNIASTRARQSEPHTEAYSASKGGIKALTHALAVSLGPEIRVNCISPGWIDTRPDALEQQSPADRNQHPCGRVGTPEDVADLTAYLLSARAGFITGQDYVIDGGMTVKMIYGS